MLHPNDLMICVPNIVFEKSMISIDFEMRAVVLSPGVYEEYGVVRMQ